MIKFPLPISDPVYIERTNYSAYELWWLKKIKDKRDLPFIALLTQIHIVVIPLAIILYTPLLQGWWWWALALPYFYISQFYFKGSFGLLLHCICHRKIWNANTVWLQKYIYWLVCPLFGHLGEGYYSHHIGMHHVLSNMPGDTSSTMQYQRDSFLDFIKYWLTFMVTGPASTALYFLKRKLPRFYLPLSWSEIIFYVLATVLCFINLKATLIVFIVPFIFARFVMMLGNWTQHAFVDVANPDDEFANSVICINTPYNHKCWNDGYHAFHHYRQAAHYTEYPAMFDAMKNDLKESRALVFSGIHYLHIFFWLMTKRYDKLADNLVNIEATFQSREDAIALMKSRTQRFVV